LTERDQNNEVPDVPGWKKEHGIDHADYLDALLDPDDPLHDVAREAAACESPN
jgi:hypothetical protein